MQYLLGRDLLLEMLTNDILIVAKLLKINCQIKWRFADPRWRQAVEGLG
jgi:hypothetical protein